MKHLSELAANQPQKRFSKGNPVDVPIRERGKKTRLYIDNEYFTGGYAALFTRKRCLEVYSALAMHANAKDQTAFPSIARVILLTGIKNRNTVCKALKILEGYNLLWVEHGGTGRPNRYHFLSVAHWKPVGSIAIDTILAAKKATKSVSTNTPTEYQKTAVDSSTADTPTHIINSEKEIPEENTNTTLKEDCKPRRLVQPTKGMLEGYFSDSDIEKAVATIPSDGSLNTSTVTRCLALMGAVPERKLHPVVELHFLGAASPDLSSSYKKLTDSWRLVSPNPAL